MGAASIFCDIALSWLTAALAAIILAIHAGAAAARFAWEVVL